MLRKRLLSSEPDAAGEQSGPAVGRIRSVVKGRRLRPQQPWLKNQIREMQLGGMTRYSVVAINDDPRYLSAPFVLDPVVLGELMAVNQR
jgi:hypothetical protein